MIKYPWEEKKPEKKWIEFDRGQGTIQLHGNEEPWKVRPGVRLLGSLSGFVPVSVNTGLLARPVKDNVSNETDKHGP